jgi:putative heme-binding domain-containing protein
VLLEDNDPEVRRLARRLAVNFQDLQALRRSLEVALDNTKAVPERVDAIGDLAIAHPAEARLSLQNLLIREANPEIQCEVCRALAGYDHPDIAHAVLREWKTYSPAVRVEAINLLAGRKEWARELLAAVAKSKVPRTDLNDNTILRLRALRDKKLNAQIESVWGRVRDHTPAELNVLIERMRSALYDGRGSFNRGRKIFEIQCAKCHKFEGQGHDVGPNLDGAARDIDYLLVNVLDPNRVVGQPYYTRFALLKNGRVETGLLAAEDAQSITLKTENDALKVIQKKDIDELAVQEKSLMPEGLNNNMSPQDFRDLIRYVMANPFLTEVAVASVPASAVNLLDPLHSDKVTWNRPAVGPPGRIPLLAPPSGEEGVACVVAQVIAPATIRTRLQIGASHSVQVWLNGKSVYNGTPSNGAAQPDQDSVSVDLREGVNPLVFEVRHTRPNGGLYARLLDPQRKLKYPEASK